MRKWQGLVILIKPEGQSSTGLPVGECGGNDILVI